MFNKFCKKPLWECSKELTATAMGAIPAETVITNAKLINVCTKEVMENTDVAIHSGRIALVGDASHCIGADTKVIDAKGMYIAPGMLDGHIHIESSMMSPVEYARAVIPHGTTGIYYDPHEICNVLGFEGVELMMKDAEKTPLKAMLTVPSCVPAVPGFEDNGAVIIYENGVKAYGGLMLIDGEYYYARSSGEIVCGKGYYITKTNDLLPAAHYTFDANGKMINK